MTAAAYEPSWDHLKGVLGSAHSRALVCSPYITESGVNRLFDILPGGVGLDVVTRLSPSDWAAKVSDPEAVLTLLQLWREAGNATNLQIVQRVHAKVYSADDLRVMVGSSNLSEGGFDRNVELAVELAGDAAQAAVRALRSACAPYAKEVSLEALAAWVECSRSTVLAARAASAKEPEDLSGVQAQLDRMLGYGVGASNSLSADPINQMQSFMDWLKAHTALSGAGEILIRHENSRRDNLTGHVRQCFAGAFRFLDEAPEFIHLLSDALGQVDKDKVFQVPSEVLEKWGRHLDAHALDRGDHYSYPTLRGILPPAYGGTRQGGGGGISTFKRILPLVARYLKESGLGGKHGS